MIEAYSQNITVTANQAIPFNNVSLEKGCTAELITPTTIQFNKCGVYMVSCNASVSTASTIQLYKNGTAQPQASSTGTSLNFTTLVTVPNNNSDCPCVSPTTIQVLDNTAGTISNANIVVTKVC